MRFEHVFPEDLQIPANMLCDGCGYKPVFSADAKCPTCVSLEVFAAFASEMNDAFGSIAVFSQRINDELMAIENCIYDDPGLDVEVEKLRIRQMIAERIQGVLSEFGLEVQ